MTFIYETDRFIMRFIAAQRLRERDEVPSDQEITWLENGIQHMPWTVLEDLVINYWEGGLSYIWRSDASMAQAHIKQTGGAVRFDRRARAWIFEICGDKQVVSGSASGEERGGLYLAVLRALTALIVRGAYSPEDIYSNDASTPSVLKGLEHRKLMSQTIHKIEDALSRLSIRPHEAIRDIRSALIYYANSKRLLLYSKATESPNDK